MMPKKFFKRILPSKEKIAAYRILKPLFKYEKTSVLWAINRHSISLSTAIGVFFGAQIIPMHILLAACTAFLLRVNLPCAMLFVMWNNPLTAAPIYYFNYFVGAILLRYDIITINFATIEIKELIKIGGEIAIALLLGSLLVGIAAALIVYFIVALWWDISLLNYTRQRRHRKLLIKK